MYRIGRLAKLTDTKVPTIRFYEARGLLRAAERNAGNQRLYDEEDVKRLRFIRHARALGFSLESIATLLDLGDHPERPCKEAHMIARGQLAEVRAKIARLKALEGELDRMACENSHSRVADCRVIEALSSAA